MRILILLLLPLLAHAGDAPRIFYSKTFPGSKPAYMEIRLERDGKAEYREAPNEEDPIVFKLQSGDVETIFALSDKLEHFNRQLESGLKVARMGDKLLRWESGTQKHETRFNYTLDPDGQLIYDWFEKMCESALLYIDLERTVKYDRLGVHQALLKLETAWDRKRLVGTDQYLKLLDRVSASEAYMNMARDRAAKLAMIFRDPPPPAGADKTAEKSVDKAGPRQ